MDRLSALGVSRARARGALSVIVLALAICASLPRTAMSGAQATGTLSVIVRSTAAARPPLRATIDAAICGPTLPDETVIVTRGLVSNAVVTLPGLKGSHPAAIDAVNDKCRFVPHAAIAAPGATIRMVSRDATLHTVHALHQGKSLFNVGLPVPNLTVARPVSGTGAVLLKCNTHPWMSGFVFLTEDRAALSNAEGAAIFEQVPAGVHAVSIWHEALGTIQARATVAAGQRATVEVTLPGR
jgi:plastocyanin